MAQQGVQLAGGREIVLPLSKAVEIALRSLKIRFGRSLITGIRVRDLKRGWFVYRWKAQRDQVDGFIENQKRKTLERLETRLEYEQKNEFYNCATVSCRKYPFDDAIEVSFKCQVCSKPLNLVDNATLKDALEWKIDQINSNSG